MARLGLLLLVGLMLAGIGNASPERGGRSGLREIAANSAYAQTLVFRGGERACVIARARKAEGSLSIEVQDARGQVVVSNKDYAGYAVVFWYPPRDAEYRVLVHNSSSMKHGIYVSIK